MLDRDGFRPNVGIILLNQKNQVFWGKRIRTHSWQFPQGGIDRGESPEQAMFRELHEEIGLKPEHVRILARTREVRGGKLNDPRFGKRQTGEGQYAETIAQLFDRTARRLGLVRDGATPAEMPSTFRRPGERKQLDLFGRS